MKRYKKATTLQIDLLALDLDVRDDGERVIDFLGRDDRRVAVDHPFIRETAQSPVDGGRGEIHAHTEFGLGNLRIALDFHQKLAVEVVELGCLASQSCYERYFCTIRPNFETLLMVSRNIISSG